MAKADHRSRLAIFAIVFALSSAGPALAQTIDTTLWVTNGAVNALARDGGTLYVGGSFTQVGPATGGFVAIDSTTGVAHQPYPLVVGSVNAIVPDGSGGWYIGGLFTAVRGQARNNLAHLDVAGHVTAWNPNANQEVYCLALSGGKIYAGGFFTQVGGQTRNRIAAIDAASGAVSAWDPNASASVWTIAVRGNTIYAAGDFSSIGGQTRNLIGAVDASSGLATTWNPAATGTRIYSLALASSGDIVYAGGLFSAIGGKSRNNIAALDTASGGATGWKPDASAAVWTITVSGNTVYAGGQFTTIGGQSRSLIAALDSSGAATSWIAPMSGSVVAGIAVSGNTVYACGTISFAGAFARNGICAVDAVTGNATSWNPNANSTVRTVVASGGTVCAGGFFGSVGGLDRSNVAALDAASGVATNWNPNANGAVSALVATRGTIYVGGTFSHIGGQTRHNIAAIDSVSGTATGWNPNCNSSVYALAVAGGTVYAGGAFATIGGQTRNNIAALDTANGAATGWNPNANVDVTALAVSGSVVYAGGYFSNIGGQARLRIAALDSSGAATTWNANVSGPMPHVDALAVSGGTIYVGGLFINVGGAARANVAAVDAGTGAATSWNPNANDMVSALAVSGGAVFAGGRFTTIGGQTRSRIAALDAATGVAANWNPGTAGGFVNALAVSGSRIHAGGGFASVGARPQTWIASIGSLVITGVNPASGGNNGGVVTVGVSGAGVQSGAAVELTRLAQPNIVGADVVVAPDGGSLTASLDLTGTAIGSWNVIVSNPDGQIATLANGFAIEAVEAPQLRLDLVGRDSMRTNFPTAFDLVVNNLGNVDAVGVPVWVSGIPLSATVGLGFPLSYPHRDAGEPDWSLDSTSFTSGSGRYLVLMIPRVPPGTVSRRITLAVPPSVASFILRAAIAPPWSGSNLRDCLAGAGVISNGACVDARLAAIGDSLANDQNQDAMSGIGVWSKVAWQCENATTLIAAQNKAHVILDYMKQPIEQGTAAAGCGDALLPRWRDALSVVTASSIDPNDKLGARKRLSIGQSLPYTVLFENLSTAGLPARHVRVVDNLDLSKLDPSTVRLGAITIGDVTVFPTDPRATNFSPADVPLRPGMSVRVRVTVDHGFGLLTWDFESIDPATGNEPSDSFAGFLPPNQSPPAGQGSVQFTVTPVGQLADGASIQNGAAITFDGTTNNTTPWGTTVDNTAPTSHVMLGNGPVDFRDSTQFTVRWEALNAPPDLKDFTIYVSENGAPFHSWIENTTTTAAQYPVGGAFRYAFYSVARDTCGNVETAPSAGQDTMFVLATPRDAAPLRLSLEGARPNPTRGALRVWFALPSREPATLELIDVMGRRVLKREVGALGPGRHAVALGAPSIRAGLYFLRLSQDGQTRIVRVAVVR
jgi:hypothetical protein